MNPQTITLILSVLVAAALSWYVIQQIKKMQEDVTNMSHALRHQMIYSMNGQHPNTPQAAPVPQQAQVQAPVQQQVQQQSQAPQAQQQQVYQQQPNIPVIRPAVGIPPLTVSDVETPMNAVPPTQQMPQIIPMPSMDNIPPQQPEEISVSFGEEL